MNRILLPLFAASLGLAFWATAQAADSGTLEEWRVKREEVFAFKRAPAVERDGDRIAIAFESEGYCDVTVAIENAEGRIVRHLASGVLGENAPPPFEKNAKAQKIVWDGKDDRGHYIDDKDAMTVRVSLGLNPQFERALYWEPKKRIGAGGGLGASSKTTLPVPLVCAAPEGVYVFEGHGVDHLRLFDHDGNYLRTIYPFPANKLDKVEGLKRATFPQDGLNLPLKVGYVQGTLLTSGATSSFGKGASMWGSGAVAMSVRGGRIALAGDRLNRIATDGSSGGLPLTGAATEWPVAIKGIGRNGEKSGVSPTSIALSPDGKWVYLAGYQWREGRAAIDLTKGCLSGVARVPYDGEGKAERFAGSLDEGVTGTKPGEFADATGVDCDAQGRVYVADFMNDRVQVFSPDGKFLKAIATPKPARMNVHPKTGEIYVCSWAMQNDATMGANNRKSDIHVKAQMTVFGSFDNPGKERSVELPFQGYSGQYKYNDKWGGLNQNAVLDPWADPPTVWVVSGNGTAAYVSGGGTFVEGQDNWDRWNLRLYAWKGGKLELKRDFGADVAASVARPKPPMYWRQRLYVNPKTEKLFVGEQVTDLGKCFNEVMEIDPTSGKIRKVKLPFDSEDMAFDMDGLVYLRSLLDVARYDPETWREVPFDYGEERGKMTANNSGGNAASAISVLPLYTGTLWHKGGIWINPKGHIAVSCYATKDDMPHFDKRTDEKRTQGGSDVAKGEKHVKGNIFVPRFFPGRNYYGEIHIFDRHGQTLHSDQVPGIAIIDGLHIDQDDAVYLMAGSTRMIGAKTYFSDFTGTLMKFSLNKGRVLTMGSNREPVPLTVRPDGPPSIRGTVQGNAWVKDADWFYGGVGYSGRGAGSERAGGATCACYNTRFAMDYFNRSFAPEFDRCKIAVVDTNGNLILRFGQYGNADDGKPMVPGGGSPAARSIGGDEVGLFYPVYVGTHSDRRVFVSDPGNARIVSVKLGYHAEERVSLGKVPDAGKVAGR
ncbi:MAG: SMP-30/gluconolactonase/LRE family protein [Planctomycetes bacterium]|nr:SMP-30/gluconolactonase/LRE family protein [Planctomycetota bacterium]